MECWGMPNTYQSSKNKKRFGMTDDETEEPVADTLSWAGKIFFFVCFSRAALR